MSVWQWHCGDQSSLLLRNLVNQIESRLDALITDGHAGVKCLVVCVTVKLKEVKRVGAGDSDQVA